MTSLAFRFLRPNYARSSPIPPDMKKILILSLLISFAVICSCQKQGSVAEQDLAQRKLELDAREEAIDKRLNALDEKVNALDEKVSAFAEEERSTMDAGTTPTAVQSETPDLAQVESEMSDGAVFPAPEATSPTPSATPQ